MPRKYDPFAQLGERLLERFVFPLMDQVFDQMIAPPPQPRPVRKKARKPLAPPGWRPPRPVSPPPPGWRILKPTHYDTLQVSRHADREVIRAAYRNLSQRFHPDHNQGNKAAEERFKKIAEAYAVLEDAQKRAAYDRTI